MFMSLNAIKEIKLPFTKSTMVHFVPSTELCQTKELVLLMAAQQLFH